METITVRAVYRKGALRPQEKLELPENTVVQVQVTPIADPAKQPGSLFGAFPELATLSGDDFDWAKRLWEHGIEKQSRIMDGLE